MIQNMSTFTCPTCRTKTDIFGGQGGLAQKTETLGLSLVGDVPLDARICADADRGKPTVVAEGELDSGGASERKKAFDGIAGKVRAFLNL